MAKPIPELKGERVMNAEKLKVIAEGMGLRDPYINIRGKVHYWCKDGREHFEYCPDTTNNDQMVEIMERLKMCLLNDDKGITAFFGQDVVTDCFYKANGETVNEAVCNTAFKYFNER